MLLIALEFFVYLLTVARYDGRRLHTGSHEVRRGITEVDIDLQYLRANGQFKVMAEW